MADATLEVSVGRIGPTYRSVKRIRHNPTFRLYHHRPNRNATAAVKAHTQLKNTTNTGVSNPN